MHAAASPGLWLQYALVALAVLLSAVYVARHRFPAAVRSLRSVLALSLLRGRKPAWVQHLGRSIAPPPAITADGACGGCNGCGPGPGKS